MPATYNGVGTRYHGKSNLQTRTGVCRSCGRAVQLQSYDTRLWIVFLYIPIIPLGRKHIIDSCPACRRHYVTDQDKWETARQLETSGAMDKFRTNPTPENGVAAHQQLIGFHQIAEAAELQKTLLAQFPDNAKVCAYLASAQEHLGRRDDAAQLYKRALELRPDLPEARIGSARGYMRAGRLDEARKMLDFLEKSGASQLYSLEPLETLARAFQNTGRHQDALDLFNRILEELPKVAEHPGFRKAVKASEKALTRDRSILPKQKFSLKRMFDIRSPNTGRQVLNLRGVMVVGVLLALIMLGFAISNEYIRHHRQLYLLNGYETPATVEISGVGVVRNFKGIRDISVPEGHFHAKVSGPVSQELDFDVRDSYFDRWSGDSVWIINVGGGALLEETVAVYSANPQPPTISFHVGQPFEHLTGVTHPFTTLPASVQIPEGGSKTLIQLDLFKGDGADVFGYYETKRSPNEAMTFAESWLRAHPDDSLTLESYAETAAHEKQTGRLDSFLQSGMTNRPVLIEWHRVYQTLHDHGSGHAGLVTEYETMLQADPTNSALLYLRGRLESDRAIAHDYFKRAAEGDPLSPFPRFALGFDRASAGDWDGAKPLIARAAELNPQEMGFAHWLFLARLMTGEAPTLEQESRSKLRSPDG